MMVGVAGSACRVPSAPADTRSRLPTTIRVERRAEAKAAGIEVRAALGAWDGPLDVEDISEPVAIEIINRSGRPLYIGPSTFLITDVYGNQYGVLPLFAPEPDVLLPSEVEPSWQVGDDIVAEGFYVDPRYAELYPELQPYGLSLEDLGGESLLVVPPPEPGEPPAAMLRSAIPRGVLVDGGRLAGFLFFESVQYVYSGLILESRFIDPVNIVQVATLDLGFYAGA